MLFDYIWHDPFSIEKNTELWTKKWFSFLKSKSKNTTCLMTYSVAKKTRNNLTESGWKIKKIPTSGNKKSWLHAKIN